MDVGGVANQVGGAGGSAGGVTINDVTARAGRRFRILVGKGGVPGAGGSANGGSGGAWRQRRRFEFSRCCVCGRWHWRTWRTRKQHIDCPGTGRCGSFELGRNAGTRLSRSGKRDGGGAVGIFFPLTRGQAAAAAAPPGRAGAGVAEEAAGISGTIALGGRIGAMNGPSGGKGSTNRIFTSGAGGGGGGGGAPRWDQEAQVDRAWGATSASVGPLS